MDHIIEHHNFLTLSKSFNPSMRVEPKIFTNSSLSPLIYAEHIENPETSALTQLSQVCSLPGVISVIGLPDLHAGYGFPIGCVAGFRDDSIISPGGVGYDINCGVRSTVTNLMFSDIKDDFIADLLFKKIPTGIGPSCLFKYTKNDINDIINNGADFLVNNKIIADEREFIESKGRMDACSKFVSQKSKARGINQVGSLGAGNHYLEVQVVDRIFNQESARLMGINRVGQVLITIHTGSRAVGYNVCDDFLKKIGGDDPLAYVDINSQLGKNYILAMGGAANFAFVNRALISKVADDCFKEVFPHFESKLIYDVCHNIAKKERHFVDGKNMDLIIHRKGASRAFGPHCEDVPDKYKEIGQPVLAGGSMGTSSYILTGTGMAMKECLGSSCHGAGRAIRRSMAAKRFTVDGITELLKQRNIILRCGSSKGIIEEAPDAYKDMDVVAEYCEECNIADRVCRVKPLIVIKG